MILGVYTVEKEYKVFVADGTERKGIRARFTGIKIEDRVYKETFMTHGDTHEHENNKVFSYQRARNDNNG